MKIVIVVLILCSILFVAFKIGSFVMKNELDDSDSKIGNISIKFIVGLLYLTAIILFMVAFIKLGIYLYNLL